MDYLFRQNKENECIKTIIENDGGKFRQCRHFYALKTVISFFVANHQLSKGQKQFMTFVFDVCIKAKRIDTDCTSFY